LQIGQGALAAPQLQARLAIQGRSEWASQTQRRLLQRAQKISPDTTPPKTLKHSAGALPNVPALRKRSRAGRGRKQDRARVAGGHDYEDRYEEEHDATSGGSLMGFSGRGAKIGISAGGYCELKEAAN